MGDEPIKWLVNRFFVYLFVLSLFKKKADPETLELFV